jgi:hypothetical protein
MKSKKSLSIFHLLFILLSLSIIFIIKKYDLNLNKIKTLFQKPKNIEALVTAIDGKKIISTVDDFESTLQILKQAKPGIEFLNRLPINEQKKAYVELLNNYVITNYLIKEYLDELGITNTEEFKKEYEQFIQIFSTSFYSNLFQKTISETLSYDTVAAEEFYEKNKLAEQEFQRAPFIIETPGIESKAIKMDEGKKLTEYKDILKAGKDQSIINLGRIHAETRSVIPEVIQQLESMKDGEVSEINLANGMNFALYRIKKHEGKWKPFNEVAKEVEQVMKIRLLDQRCTEVLEAMKAKQRIEIKEETMNKFVEKNQAINAIMNLDSSATKSTTEEASEDETELDTNNIKN